MEFLNSNSSWKNVSRCFLFQVHVRVASPPLLYPCYMGINIPTREELIANKLNPVKLAKHVGK
jgi:glutamine phosphoribosylpyrophosphate amidotransferase